jgi:hypothetical protein
LKKDDGEIHTWTRERRGTGKAGKLPGGEAGSHSQRIGCRHAGSDIVKWGSSRYVGGCVIAGGRDASRCTLDMTSRLLGVAVNHRNEGTGQDSHIPYRLRKPHDRVLYMSK